MRTESLEIYDCRKAIDPSDVGGMLNMPIRNISEIENIDDLEDEVFERPSSTPIGHQGQRTPDDNDSTWI